MANFSHFLLVSDYDHTLTDHTGCVPDANREAIAYFIRCGGAFTVCTGRSLPASRHIFQTVPMNAPLLFCNGAGCHDLQTDTPIFCRELPQDADALIRWCLEAFPDLRLEVHTTDGHYAFREDLRRDASLARRDVKVVYPVSFSDIPHPWVKFSLYSRDGDVAVIDPRSPRGQYFTDAARAIAEKAGSDCLVTHSMPGLIEVQPAGTSKGLAARDLAKKLGRSVLVCAGDAPNDISMLEEADLPFLAADGDSRMMDLPYRKAAPSHEGTVADIIRILEEETT